MASDAAQICAMEGISVNHEISPSFRTGQWLFNALVAAVIGVFVAVLVVAITIVVDRSSTPGIEIVPRGPIEPVVYLTGAVATPGVYALPANGRVADALSAAGGLADGADGSQLNLAARVGDGEHIDIPAIATVDDGISAGTPEVAGRINVSTATVAELDTLPGIGPVLAERIVADREANGPYASVDSLARVDGISDATVDELRPLVTVDE